VEAGRSGLRLYIDSASTSDWEKYLPLGLFYGVTTNPKLLRSVGIRFNLKEITELAAEAFYLGAGEIHLQVWGESLEDYLERGRALSDIDPRVRVKVPIDRQGMLAAATLIGEGIPVTLTALHAAKQALSAAALVPAYAAPYLGRMNDAGRNGLQEVLTMNEILRSLESPIRLLVASIRSIPDLVALAAGGLDTFTLTPPRLEELIEDELTRAAVEAFAAEVEG
jgi:transaldolase